MAKVIPIVRIVDDDETFCMSQKMFLQAMGWFVLIYPASRQKITQSPETK